MTSYIPEHAFHKLVFNGLYTHNTAKNLLEQMKVIYHPVQRESKGAKNLQTINCFKCTTE